MLSNMLYGDDRSVDLAGEVRLRQLLDSLDRTAMLGFGGGRSFAMARGKASWPSFKRLL